MTADDAARIEANHRRQRAKLTEQAVHDLHRLTPPVRAEYERALAPKDMDPEERWYALHDGWVGEH